MLPAKITPSQSTIVNDSCKDAKINYINIRTFVKCQYRKTRMTTKITCLQKTTTKVLIKMYIHIFVVGNIIKRYHHKEKDTIFIIKDTYTSKVLIII